MFKKTSQKTKYFSFFRVYFLEFGIFLGLLTISMMGILYYFKHHPVKFFTPNHRIVAAHTIESQPQLQSISQEESDFEFYTLLAEGNDVLPANLG